jgi:hypothetical protein
MVELIAHNGLYILDILKLSSVIIMVTYVNTVAGDKSGGDEELVYAGEYLLQIDLTDLAICVGYIILQPFFYS